VDRLVESVRRGDRVVVSGDLVMERVDGPIEDDLSAVRMWIKATSVASRDPYQAPWYLASSRAAGRGGSLPWCLTERGTDWRPSAALWATLGQHDIPKRPPTADDSQPSKGL
jgi:hypothetical protein